MQTPDRKQVVAFLLRFAIVFVVLHLPLPWLADAYAYAYASAANYMLCPIMNQLSDVTMEFEPPESIAAQGQWKGNLRIQSNLTGQVAPYVLVSAARHFLRTGLVGATWWGP